MLKQADRCGRKAAVATMILLTSLLSGCAAAVVGAAVGTAATIVVETAKVPVKVTGAVVDVVADD